MTVRGETAGEAEISIYDFQSNWDDVEKERQRQEDQQERLLPGPAPRVSPPHSPDDARRNLRLESVGEDEYGGNDMIIWRDEGHDPAVEPNPYEFSWEGEGSDQFLP